MNQMSSPQKGFVRRAVKLTAGQSISGKITVIIPSLDCQFPDNTTDVEIEGVGINLHDYTIDFPPAPLAFNFNKVKITAGKCIVGME